MTLAADVVDRLLLGKFLLGHIRSTPVARPDRLTIARHLLAAHDAAELVIAGIAQHLECLPPSPKTYLMDYFEKINLLDILCRLYAEIILPEAVINEFGTPTIDCYSSKRVESPLVRLLVSDLNLGKGESEVIAWGRETGMRIIIDDLKARKVAETLELNLTGTIGILLKAEKLGFIDSAHDKAKELRDKGFYVSDQLLDDMSRLEISD